MSHIGFPRNSTSSTWFDRNSCIQTKLLYICEGLEVGACLQEQQTSTIPNLPTWCDHCCLQLELHNKSSNSYGSTIFLRKDAENSHSKLGSPSPKLHHAIRARAIGGPASPGYPMEILSASSSNSENRPERRTARALSRGPKDFEPRECYQKKKEKMDPLQNFSTQQGTSLGLTLLEKEGCLQFNYSTFSTCKQQSQLQGCLVWSQAWDLHYHHRHGDGEMGFFHSNMVPRVVGWMISLCRSLLKIWAFMPNSPLSEKCKL